MINQFGLSGDLPVDRIGFGAMRLSRAPSWWAALYSTPASSRARVLRVAVAEFLALALSSLLSLGHDTANLSRQYP
jgi:hypothetical protein